MILSNVEVHRALDEGRLIIDPEPAPRFKDAGGHYCPYDTHTVDLTLSDEISIPLAGTYTYDLTQEGKLADFMKRNSDRKRLETPYPLERNKFILGMTRERIGLPMLKGRPTCLAARIEGKSSRARCGVLIHFTAPTVHPGWDGPLTLEIINLGPAPFMMVPGMPIAQLIVEEVRGIPAENYSQYHGQKTPEGITDRPERRSAPPRKNTSSRAKRR